MRITPALFDREGRLEVREILGTRDSVLASLKDSGVFALDTAMRIATGHGFLSSGDVHVYLTSDVPLKRLAESKLIESTPSGDRVLVRAWPGLRRLFAAVVEQLPPSRTLPNGFRVVSRARLREELIGSVGARADLFALAERLDS